MNVETVKEFHLDFIDGFRGLAAFYVFVTHLFGFVLEEPSLGALNGAWLIMLKIKNIFDYFTWNSMLHPAVINIGKPPALPGDSQSLTFSGIFESLSNVNRPKNTKGEAFDGK